MAEVLSRRERICVRLLAVIGAMEGIETASRNQGRLADTKLPAATLYDRDEDPFENPQAVGAGPNVIYMTPSIVVSLGAVPEDIGTKANAWLAKVQKAVLFDTELAAICGARTTNDPRARRGARYVGCSSGLDEGRTSELSLTVFFSIAYPLIPTEL